MNDDPVIFVHGLMGWGPGELATPYWGEMNAVKDDQPLPVFEASVGPVSSYHDRACELAAQIMSTRTDYGERHAAEAGHARFGDDQANGFHPSWSEASPVHLVGHSAGAHTALYLQRLLAGDYWGWGSSANWIKSVTCIAGVLNGSTLTYMLGSDKATGLIEPRSVANLALHGVKLFTLATGGAFDERFKVGLDHWLPRREGDSLRETFRRLKETPFAKGEDNLAYCLTLQGCRKANAQVNTNPGTFYMSYVTEQTTRSATLGVHLPEFRKMNPALYPSAIYQGRFHSDIELIPNWGDGMLEESKWHGNDGAVSAISQRHPFTAGKHPVAGQGVPAGESIKPGRWYWEALADRTGQSWGHLDVGFGVLARRSLVEPQRAFYRHLFERLASLPA